jgi:hypothetical protein
MGQHRAPRGEVGKLPNGAELTRTSEETGRHRVNRGTEDTDPELRAVQPEDDNAEGWRN